MLFSVGILSLKERENIFLPSLDKFYTYIKKYNLEDRVEIIVESDNRELTIGEKRNNVVNKAKGKMLAFIDDDDLVTEDYFKLIVEKIESNENLDVIGITSWDNNILSQKNDQYVYRTINSEINKKVYINNKLCKNWPTGQLNPIKTSLAKDIMFPKINIHEDFCYGEKIKNKLKNFDAITHKYIYHYRYNTNTTSIKRKPIDKKEEKLYELYLSKNPLMEYDLNGNITDKRYFKILNEN